LRRHTRGDRRVTWATAVGLFLGAVPFAAVLLDFRTDLLRTAVSFRFASNFFDLQAEALMDGHLWVPDDSLGIEGFEVGGRTYMYFPPFPALARIPVMLVTDEFNGRLTLVFMAVAMVLFAAMTAKLLWLVRGCIRGDLPVSRTEAVTFAVFLAAVTGGSVLTFDAALPWAYHEVYLWSAALVVGAAYWLIRCGLEPSAGSVCWLGVFLLGAMLTRTTGGWAMCLVTIATGLWVAVGRTHRGRWGAASGLAAVGAGVLLLGIGLNVVKFGHPYLFPLEHQVWTDLNAHRREALAANGGTITGPQFFETALVNYFRLDGIRFVDWFPFITLPAEPARAYGGAFLDQSYRTGSITSFMALLLLLSLASIPVVLRLRGAAAAALRLPLLGTVLVTGGVMAYGYVTYRYTSEFVPALVVGGSIGLSGVWLLLDRAGGLARVARAGGVVAMVGLTVFSVAAQVATGSQVAAQTWRGDRLVGYLDLQRRVSGGPGTAFADLVVQSPYLPGAGQTDQLHVRGNCDALYQHIGDRYEPWVVVQQRDLVVTVSADRGGQLPGQARLFQLDGVQRRVVMLEIYEEQARLVIDDPHQDFYGPPFDLRPGESVDVVAHARPQIGQVAFSAAGTELQAPLMEWTEDWVSIPTLLTDAVGDDKTLDALGLTLHDHEGDELELCSQLLRDAGPVRDESP
jgi:hypothetical protein